MGSGEELSDEIKSKIISLKQNGLNIRQIAAALLIGKSSVQKWIARYNLVSFFKVT